MNFCSLWLLPWRWSSSMCGCARSCLHRKYKAGTISAVFGEMARWGYMVGGAWGDGRSWPLASRFWAGQDVSCHSLTAGFAPGQSMPWRVRIGVRISFQRAGALLFRVQKFSAASFGFASKCSNWLVWGLVLAARSTSLELASLNAWIAESEDWSARRCLDRLKKKVHGDLVYV